MEVDKNLSFNRSNSFVRQPAHPGFQRSRTFVNRRHIPQSIKQPVQPLFQGFLRDGSVKTIPEDQKITSNQLATSGPELVNTINDNLVSENFLQTVTSSKFQPSATPAPSQPVHPTRPHTSFNFGRQNSITLSSLKLPGNDEPSVYNTCTYKVYQNDLNQSFSPGFYNHFGEIRPDSSTISTIPLTRTNYDETDGGNALPRYIRPISGIFPRSLEYSKNKNLPCVISFHPFNDSEKPIPIVGEVENKIVSEFQSKCDQKIEPDWSNLSNLGTFDIKIKNSNWKQPITAFLFDATRSALLNRLHYTTISMISSTQSENVILAVYESNLVYVLTTELSFKIFAYEDGSFPEALLHHDQIIFDSKCLPNALTILQKYFSQTNPEHVASRGNLLFATKIVTSLINQNGQVGQILAFHGKSLPIGLQSKNVAKQNLNSKEEFLMLTHDEDSPFSKEIRQFQDRKVSISTFVFKETSKENIDLATIGYLSSYTGGSLFKYGRSLDADEETKQRFRKDLVSTLESSKFDVVCTIMGEKHDFGTGLGRVKIGRILGVHTDNYLKNPNSNDYVTRISLPRMSNRSSFLVQIRPGGVGHTGKIVIFTRYSDKKGEFLRVHRYHLPHHDEIEDYRSHFDPDVFVKYIVMMYFDKMEKKLKSGLMGKIMGKKERNLKQEFLDTYIELLKPIGLNKRTICTVFLVKNLLANSRA